MKKQLVVILAAVLISTNSFSQFKAYHPYWFRTFGQTSVPTLKNVSLSTGVTLQYAEQGNRSKFTVLFLHGFTDSWLSFKSVMEALPPSVHCISVTQRGHGDSQRPDNEYALNRFSEDIAAFIRELGLNNVLLVGHSFGGLVAQRFAVDHPELLKGMMLLGTTSNFNIPALREFAVVVNSLTEFSAAFIEEFQQGTVTQTMDTAYFKALVMESCKMPLPVWKSVLSKMVKEDLREDIGRIQAPVKILWGEQDAFCSKEDQETMRRRMPDAELIVMSKNGHAVHWEDPGFVADEIVQFLSDLQRR